MGPAYCVCNYAYRTPSPEPPPAVTATTAYTLLERPECAVEGESSLRLAALPHGTAGVEILYFFDGSCFQVFHCEAGSSDQG